MSPGSTYLLENLVTVPGWCALPWPGCFLSLRESGDLGPSGHGEPALRRRQAAFVRAAGLPGASSLDARSVLVATQTHSLRVICPLADGRLHIWEGTWNQALDNAPADPDKGSSLDNISGPGFAAGLDIRLVSSASWDTGDIPGLAARTGAMEADGWLTDHPGLDLGVTVADCMSLFFHSPDPAKHLPKGGGGNRPVRGLVHSGWQGTGISRVLLHAARQIWNLEEEDFAILAGPSITALDYPVDSARARLFARRFGQDTVLARQDGQTCLDLVAANQALCKRNILACGNSTLQEPSLHSYRRDGKEAYGRMLALWKGRT